MRLWRITFLKKKSGIVNIDEHNLKNSTGVYIGYVRKKKLHNFLFFSKKVKAQQKHSIGQKHNFPMCKRFLNGSIPWSGVNIMVLSLMSGKNKVDHFQYNYESHGSSHIFVTVFICRRYTLIYNKLGLNFHFDMRVWA